MELDDILQMLVIAAVIPTILLAWYVLIMLIFGGW